MEIVAFASLKYQLELWFPETSLFWFLWPEQSGEETLTLQKKPGLRWEERRTAVLQGGPPFLGGVIPEGQVPTWGLSPWGCVSVTREGSRRSFSCLLALIAHFGNLQSHSQFCSKACVPQAAVASWLALLNCWAALRPALPWLWEPPAVWGSEMVAVCSALVQLGALVCIPWLLSAALGSKSNRGVGSQLISQVAPDIKSSRWLRVSKKLFEMVEVL